jgi:hypothetical protein
VQASSQLLQLEIRQACMSDKKPLIALDNQKQSAVQWVKSMASALAGD